MAILKTEAVILSIMPQGETSKIVRTFTKDYGRISFIAKGSRKLKNRFGGSLDQLNHVKIIYYDKENRDLQIATQCDIINSFPDLKSDLEKLSFGFAIVEVIVSLVVEEETNANLFDLLIKTLNVLEYSDKNYDNIYWYFLIRFLRQSGFGLSLGDCLRCSRKIENETAFFSIAEGGLICNSCSDAKTFYLKMAADTLQIIRIIEKKEPEKFQNLRISQNTKRDLNKLFDDYYRYHFEGYDAPQAVKLLMT